MNETDLLNSMMTSEIIVLCVWVILLSIMLIALAKKYINSLICGLVIMFSGVIAVAFIDKGYSDYLFALWLPNSQANIEVSQLISEPLKAYLSNIIIIISGGVGGNFFVHGFVNKYLSD